MATYGTAASGLPGLVRQRKRAEYGVDEQGGADPMYGAGEFGPAASGNPFTPPEAGGFTGGELPGPVETATTPTQTPPPPVVQTPPPPVAPGIPEIAPGGPDPFAPVTTAPAPAAPAAPGVPGTPTNITDAYNQAMLDQLTKSRNPSLSDPGLKAQSDAYSVGQQRARDQARASIAERFAANGIADSGAMDQGIAGLFQQQGENQGTFNANLVGNELQNQRTELLNYMQLAGSRLTAQEAQALQAKLADIDANLRQQGITNQNDQFGRTQGWNEDIWSYLANMYPQQTVMNNGG